MTSTATPATPDAAACAVPGTAEQPSPAALVPPAIAAAAVVGGALLVDVRSEGYRERTGQLPQAVVVDKPRARELFDLSRPDHLAEVTSLDQPVVVICGSVAGSMPVVQELVGLGFTAVVHVEGGYPAWKAAGLPTTSGTEDADPA